MPSSAPAAAPAAPKRELGLFDSTCIIVGIIIGAGIYGSSPVIAGQVPSVGWLFVVWILGGLFSLLGALCYAELATAFPREGGDYLYLTRAYGRPLGFLFAWSELWVVRPGSIGAMAYVFADYANQIWPRAEGDASSRVRLAYAIGSIVLLTAINALGVRQGKWTQNLLTVGKFLGLAAIVVVAWLYAPAVLPPSSAPPPPSSSWPTLGGFGTAMILVLFAYGGWNEMGYVGAEVRDPSKNMLRALLLGTLAVTAIYLLVNGAFVYALGFQDIRSYTDAADVFHAPPVAKNVLSLALGDRAGQAISVLICISALGVINGQIFTGARIYYAMGSDHRLYAPLGRWNARVDAPVCSLLVQAAITLALVIILGVAANGFERLINFTAPAFWSFLCLVGLSLLIFRYREPDLPRPYRVLGYPVTPLVLCAGCLFMVYSSFRYAFEHKSWEAFWAVGILAIGAVLSLFTGAPRQQPPPDA